MIENHSNIPSKLRADLYLLGITLIWGSSFIAVKIALDFSSPLLFLTFRFLLASIIFFILFRKLILKLDKDTLRAGIIMGGLLGIGFGAQTYGLDYTTASKSAFVTGAFVVMVPLFSIVFEKIIPRKLLWVGVLLAIIGLYFLTSPEGSSFNYGDRFTAVGAVAFAAHTVSLQIYSKRYNFIQLTFLQLFVTALIGIITTILFETPRFEINITLLSIIIGKALFPTVLNFYIITKYQRYTSSTRAAIIYSFEPVSAALIAYIILGEVLGIRGVIGGALIFGGMII